MTDEAKKTIPLVHYEDSIRKVIGEAVVDGISVVDITVTDPVLNEKFKEFYNRLSVMPERPVPSPMLFENIALPGVCNPCALGWCDNVTEHTGCGCCNDGHVL